MESARSVGCLLRLAVAASNRLNAGLRLVLMCRNVSMYGDCLNSSVFTDSYSMGVVRVVQYFSVCCRKFQRLSEEDEIRCSMFYRKQSHFISNTDEGGKKLKHFPKDSD